MDNNQDRSHRTTRPFLRPAPLPGSACGQVKDMVATPASSGAMPINHGVNPDKLETKTLTKVLKPRAAPLPVKELSDDKFNLFNRQNSLSNKENKLMAQVVEQVMVQADLHAKALLVQEPKVEKVEVVEQEKAQVVVEQIKVQTALEAKAQVVVEEQKVEIKEVVEEEKLQVAKEPKIEIATEVKAQAVEEQPKTQINVNRAVQAARQVKDDDNSELKDFKYVDDEDDDIPVLTDIVESYKNIGLQNNNVQCLNLNGFLGIGSAAAISAIVAASRYAPVKLDLSNINGADKIGLNMLFGALINIASNKGRLEIIGGKKIEKILGLPENFPF